MKKELKMFKIAPILLEEYIHESFRTQIIKIDSGRQHTCAVKEISPPTSTPTTGTLGCWGANHHGQSDYPRLIHYSIDHIPRRLPHLCHLTAHAGMLGQEPIRTDNNPSCIQEGILGPHRIAYVCVDTQEE